MVDDFREYRRAVALSPCPRLPAVVRLGGATEKDGGGKSQKLAWTSAGWKVAEVDMETETVVFKREDGTVDRSLFDLDVVFPVHHAKLLRKDWTFSREEIYEDRV